MFCQQYANIRGEKWENSINYSAIKGIHLVFKENIYLWSNWEEDSYFPCKAFPSNKTNIIFLFIHDSGCSNRICQGKKKEISPTTASNYVEVDQTFENLEREPQQNLSLKNFEFALKLALFTYSLFPFVDFSSLIYKFSESRI